MNGDMGLRGSERSVEQAREKVAGPAIALIVAGGFGILFALFLLVWFVSIGQIPQEAFDQAFSDPNIDPKALQNREEIERSIKQFFALGPRWFIGMLLVSALALFGGLQMKNLKNYNLVMAASIVALIPCCGPCCCVGMPIGIWSIVVLMKPEVKASFGSGSRGGV
ncbi:MAG TPA: hypothetical protein VK447_18875 [Myxococcaceae bacterium]|nr:hypothetical protein [Myxococcaceae bacterium]